MRSNDLMSLIVFIFYIPVFFLLLQKKLQRRALNEFYRGVLTIIERTQDNTECIEQISIIYKKISEKYSYISGNFRSSTDIMEELLCKLSTFAEKKFAEEFKVVYSPEQRNRVVEIIKAMKIRQPFSSLSSKHGNLLNLIKTSIDSNNQGLGISSLSQLADEIEILEGTIRSQTKRNQVSLIVSAVGVILTIVFGLITLLPLVR